MQSKRRIYQLSAMYYFILESYSTHSTEFTGLKLEIIFFIYLLLLFFCWILNNNSGSGSRQKFRSHTDPDPQYCKKSPKFSCSCLNGGWQKGGDILEWMLRVNQAKNTNFQLIFHMFSPSSPPVASDDRFFAVFATFLCKKEEKFSSMF